MKVSELIARINELVVKDPKALDYVVAVEHDTMSTTACYPVTKILGVMPMEEGHDILRIGYRCE